jgi:hypothetical protein
MDGYCLFFRLGLFQLSTAQYFFQRTTYNERQKHKTGSKPHDCPRSKPHAIPKAAVTQIEAAVVKPCTFSLEPTY